MEEGDEALVVLSFKRKEPAGSEQKKMGLEREGEGEWGRDGDGDLEPARGSAPVGPFSAGSGLPLRESGHVWALRSTRARTG